MTGLINKTVLITGASSGIGEAAVRELPPTGAKLFIGACHTDRLQDLAGELGENVAWRQFDVTDAANFDAFTDAAAERFGRIDTLVSNAGVMPLSPLAELKLDEWKKMIDVNIHGVLNGIASVLPRFVAQKSGYVVNVASVGPIWFSRPPLSIAARNTRSGRFPKACGRSMTISAAQLFRLV